MPRAFVTTTQFKTGTTGGTFADTLAAGTGDSTAVANFQNGQANIIEMWGGDSDSVAEVEVLTTRPESTHDPNHGLRINIPAITPGGAANVGAQNLLAGPLSVQLFPSDTVTMTVTSTASDDIAISYTTLYDDLPGVKGVFADWSEVNNLQKSTLGIQVVAVASGTAAVQGANRAFNADDDRLHANTWYAILGVAVQTQCVTCTLLGPDWGGQKIGIPIGALDLSSTSWFVDQSFKWQFPMIPCFNSNNKGNIIVNVTDLETSTSPKLDFILYELKAPPSAVTS